MSTATHYPESGFKGGYNWPQTTLLLSAQPGTLANWQSFTALASGDLTALGTDDANGVSTECYFVGGETSYTYAGGVASRFTISDGTVSQFGITIKAVDNGGTGYHFWAYNFHTSAWEAIGSHTGSYPQTFTFSYSITSNPAYYLDGSNHFWLLICTDEYDSAPLAKLTLFMKVVDTYTGGGTAYSFTATEALGVTDAGTESRAATRAGTEALGVTDAATRARAASRAATEAVGMTDSAARVWAANRAQTEALGTTDAGSDARAAQRAATEAVGVTDLPGRAAVAQRALAESLGVTDVPGTYYSSGTGTNYILAQADGVGVTDAGSRLVASQRAASEALGVGDATTRMAVVRRTATEAFGLTDVGQALQLLPVFLSVPAQGVRRLSWPSASAVFLLIDGAVAAESATGCVDLAADRQVRGVLLATATLPDVIPTPRDEVLLTITGDPVLNHIERRLSGGAWAEVAAILGSNYHDGPLPDGTYDYEVIAEDEEGDEATSSTATVTISSVPDPPSGIALVWDGEGSTHTATVTWTASPSADAASYRVRLSAGEPTLALSSTPVQDSAALSYVQTFTDETGTFIFNVRTVDTDGNEEQNISQTVSIVLVDGALAIKVAEPRLVDATPAAGGAETVEFLYDPHYESPRPVRGAVLGEGGAAEARIYGDNGTGTVDFGSPAGVVALGKPVVATRYTWTSAALTPGATYLWVVRIATDEYPYGLETQNTHAVSSPVVPDSDVPATPELTAEVV